MPPSLFKFVLRFSLRDQLLLLLLTACSLPFVYFALDVPKLIINDVLGQGPLPEQLYGIPLGIDHTALLIVLSAAFLLLVCVNGGFKYVLNVYRGVVAERMLRRLRFTLFSNLMRFPTAKAEQLSPAETVPLITAETEPLGGYIGDALALPAFQGGLLATYVFFIMVQDPVLGCISLLTLPIQAYVTPRMQKRVNRLARRRVLATRRLSADIGDAMGGVAAIHAESNGLYHRARIAARLGTLYGLRFDIYRRKFAIKFVNSFLNHVTPFFFYLFGGWLVLQGELTIGALVAALAAFREMAPPWRELLKFYQTSQDAQVKYEQIIEQFEPADLLAETASEADASPSVSEGQAVVFSSVSAVEESGRGLAPLDFSLDAGARVAVTDEPECGADELCRVLAQQRQPDTGRVRFGSRDWLALGPGFRGRHVAYVGKDPWLFDMSLRDNLHYGCVETPKQVEPDAERELAERAGNTPLRPEDSWVESSSATYARLHRALGATGATDELIDMGMRMPLAASDDHAFQQAVLSQRAAVTAALEAEGLDVHVQRYDPQAFIDGFSIGENLLFAAATDAREWADDDAARLWITSLRSAGLLDELLEIGVKVNRELVEMFVDLPDNHPFFADLGLVDARELPAMQRVAQRVDRAGTTRWSRADRWLILSRVLALKPARHRIVDLDDAFKARAVQARSALSHLVGQPGFDALEPLDPGACADGLSVLQNALFGMLSGQDQRAHRQVRETVLGVLREAGLEGRIVDHALATQPGPGGRSLRPALRQRLALARALVKPGTWLIVNRALDALDADSEADVIDRVLALTDDTSVLWSPVHAKNAARFPVHLHLGAGGSHSVNVKGHDVPELAKEVSPE
ncbi:MAG: ABC transporter transmembrane domain-containing protein [Pseudomonadota bacterium]